MALRQCRECTTRFAVGLPACPHCASTDHEEDGMPKITRHGGPTIAGAVVVGGSWSNEGDPDVWPEPEQEGGEQSSAGSSSSASDRKPSSGPETKQSSPRKRARTTESRSTRPRTESSSARSTDGDPEDGTSATAGKAAGK